MHVGQEADLGEKSRLKSTLLLLGNWKNGRITHQEIKWRKTNLYTEVIKQQCPWTIPLFFPHLDYDTAPQGGQERTLYSEEVHRLDLMFEDLRLNPTLPGNTCMRLNCRH